MMNPRHVPVTLLMLAVLLIASAANGQSISLDWKNSPDRTWSGSQWNSNRLQDWAIIDGQLRCINSSPRDPVRTTILLTTDCDSSRGAFALATEISAGWSDAREGSFGGILFGIGGPEIDHKIRSIVHDKPAADGGILAVVHPDGRVGFRDFTTGGGGGSWSIGGPLEKGRGSLLPNQVQSGDGGQGPWILRLTQTQPLTNNPESATATRMLLTATQVKTGNLISSASLSGVSRAQLSGSFGLASHLGGTNNSEGWSFHKLQASGFGLVAHPERSLGPIYGLQYCLSRDKNGTHEWKLTAQLAPISSKEFVSCELLVAKEDEWRTVATGDFEPLSRTVNFRVKGWKADRDHRFLVRCRLRDRLGVETDHDYAGQVRAEPDADGEPIVIGLISCMKNFTGQLAWNSSSIWFPHQQVADGVASHDPDLLCFAGDQIYEGDISRAERSPPDKMLLDYHTKFLRWYRSFGELTRNTPCITIPDDHDVYHGNIWGAGGKRGRKEPGTTAQDSGGYKLAPREVNAIHRTQTSHLPDPLIDGPIGAGYSVYTTRVEYAGLSIAVISDRQFKSAPRPSVPEGNVVNGWFRNPDFDPRDADLPGLQLLGQAQEKFLDEWALDWGYGARWKFLLSQTPFSNVATLPPGKTGGITPSLPIVEAGGWPEGELPVADCDSGGWPQSPRNEAIRLLRKARAFHLAGDQHLSSCIRYGVDEFRDAGVAFAGPAVANTWPRRWFPSTEGSGEKVSEHRGSGDYLDGFGNKMTVLAVGNPYHTGRQPARLLDRGPGWGIVRVDNNKREVTFESWPRWCKPGDPDSAQYPGWPITVTQHSLDGRKPYARLEPVKEMDGMTVVSVVNSDNSEALYSYRLRPDEVWSPPVFSAGTYHIILANLEENRWKLLPQQIIP
jgi:hypothetical protein